MFDLTFFLNLRYKKKNSIHTTISTTITVFKSQIAWLYNAAIKALLNTYTGRDCSENPSDIISMLTVTSITEPTTQIITVTK